MPLVPEHYARMAHRAVILPHEEQVELVRRHQAGEVDAAEALIMSNLRLVIRYAQAFNGDQEDLISEGICGILDAIPRFDPERGKHFTGYAMLWVKARVMAYQQKRCPVRIGSRVGRRIFWRVLRTSRALQAETGDGSPEAVAAHLGVDVEEVEAILRAFSRTTSLSPHEDSNPDEWMPLDTSASPETLAARSQSGDRRTRCATRSGRR